MKQIKTTSKTILYTFEIVVETSFVKANVDVQVCIFAKKNDKPSASVDDWNINIVNFLGQVIDVSAYNKWKEFLETTDKLNMDIRNGIQNEIDSFFTKKRLKQIIEQSKF